MKKLIAGSVIMLNLATSVPAGWIREDLRQLREESHQKMSLLSASLKQLKKPEEKKALMKFMFGYVALHDVLMAYNALDILNTPNTSYLKLFIPDPQEMRGIEEMNMQIGKLGPWDLIALAQPTYLMWQVLGDKSFISAENLQAYCQYCERMGPLAEMYLAAKNDRKNAVPLLQQLTSPLAYPSTPLYTENDGQKVLNEQFFTTWYNNIVNMKTAARR
jgi:hypothetical protein